MRKIAFSADEQIAPCGGGNQRRGATMTSPAEAVDGDSGKRRRWPAGAVRNRLEVARGSARGLAFEMGKRAVETRMLDSALALASRLFVAVIPVALLVSSFLPGGQTFAERLVTGLQLHGAGRVAAERLFATPDVVRAGMTFATCLVAAWSLMSCGGVLQRTYRSAWRLETLGSDSWRRDAGRRLLWAAGLVVYVGATFGLADVSAHGVLAIARDGARVALALAFFSWGPYVLLGRQVAPRRLLPTAILGAVALGCGHCGRAAVPAQHGECECEELWAGGVRVRVRDLAVRAGAVDRRRGCCWSRDRRAARRPGSRLAAVRGSRPAPRGAGLSAAATWLHLSSHLAHHPAWSPWSPDQN